MATKKATYILDEHLHFKLKEYCLLKLNTSMNSYINKLIISDLHSKEILNNNDLDIICFEDI